MVMDKSQVVFTNLPCIPSLSRGVVDDIVDDVLLNKS